MTYKESPGLALLDEQAQPLRVKFTELGLTASDDEIKSHIGVIMFKTQTLFESYLSDGSSNLKLKLSPIQNMLNEVLNENDTEGFIRLQNKTIDIYNESASKKLFTSRQYEKDLVDLFQIYTVIHYGTTAIESLMNGAMLQKSLEVN